MQYSLILTLIGIAAVSAHHGPEVKVCLKTTEECKALKDNVKAAIRDLRATEIKDPSTDIAIYLTKLSDLFNQTSQSDCHVELCKCTDHVLTCDKLLNKLRYPLQNAKLPDCLSESEKAKAILTEFKTAAAEGDRARILEVLAKLRSAITDALATKSAEDSEKLVTCLKETVRSIRQKFGEKLAKLQPQPNCDFCSHEDEGDLPHILPVPAVQQE
jgi:hypothetical protein